jgi:hypothetical protein
MQPQPIGTCKKYKNALLCLVLYLCTVYREPIRATVHMVNV